MENIEKFWKTFGYIVLSFFIGVVLTSSYFIVLMNRAQERVIEIENEISKVIKENPDLFLDNQFKDSILREIGYYKVTATVYNPVSGQCDDSPLITADCSKIDLEQLRSGELKWVALSRDLLEYFNYGDKIYIHSKSDPSINGIYEVHDTMNIRYTNYIDILKPVDQKYGKWNDVVIKKIEEI